MVPAPRFEMLHRVASGNLAEARATARTVELQLFALEIRVADTQQQVLLDAHDGRDVDGIAFSIGFHEFVDVNQGLVGHSPQAVPILAAFGILIEGRELDPVVRKLCRDGDGRGAFDDVVSHVGAVQHIDRCATDAYWNQIGFVDWQSSGLLISFSGEFTEAQRDSIGGRLPCRNGHSFGQQRIIF